MPEASNGYSLKDYFGGSNTEGYKSYKEGQQAGKYKDFNDYLSKSGGSTTGGNDIIQNAIKLNQQANQPAVQSLEASIPETSQRFTQQREQLSAERTPLETRYKNLLDSIKGNQKVAENRQTTTTANELARRGLSNTSGLFEQELTNAVNPITQQYSNQYTDVGLQGEGALRSLGNEISNTYTGETESLRAIRNAIAQLQSGAASTGITQGIQQTQFNQQQSAAQQAAARQAALDKAQQDFQKLVYETINLPESKYATGKPYYSPNSGGGVVDDGY